MSNPDELAEKAWDLMEQALTTGSIKLENGVEYKLGPYQLIDMATKLAAVKLKRPQIVGTPEGFDLKETTSDE